MKYNDFKNRIRDLPLFSSQQLTAFHGNTQILRNQLTAWRRKGLVVRLRKGLYILNETDRRFTPSRLFLANQQYQPSYVSLEYALHFYDLIPERVADLTSVSPRKPVTYENPFGRFIYQHVKVKSFAGYGLIKDENSNHILIAGPEKALLDFLYLNLAQFLNAEQVVGSLRLQNTGILRKGKLLANVRLFDNRRLANLIEQLVLAINIRRP